MRYQNEIVFFEGKDVPVVDVLNEKKIPIDRYDYQRNMGFGIEKAFWNCLLKNCKPSENLLKKYSVPSEVLENHYRRGMHPKYRSLKHFCVSSHIDYDSFTGIYNRYPNETLAQVYKRYLAIDSLIKYSKYSFFGITLKALCLKFQLDYGYCCKMHEYNPNLSLEELLNISLINSPIFPHDFASKIQIYQTTIQKFSTFRELEAWCDRVFENKLLKKCILFYKKRIRDIKLALDVYQTVSFFENGWEELYSDEIHHFHQVYNLDFMKHYKNLKYQVRSQYLEKFQITPKNLEEYYHLHYSDYSRFMLNGEEVWGYQRKKTQFLK